MSEPQEIRVFVNERGVSVPHGASALDAVRVLFPELADDIAAGTSRLTDSRGLPIATDVALHGGAIFRVLPVRDRAEAAE
jgi:hypothetical protein